MPMGMGVEARKLSDSLDVTDRVVFFGSSWVPYERRGSMLLEADLGVSLHLDGMETRFSFRTRVLDYLWAGLPILTTEGDSMADLVASEELGAVVPYRDDAAVADALAMLVSDTRRRQACANRSSEVAQRFLWSSTVSALARYCRAPYPAPDRQVIHAESREVVWDGRQPALDGVGRLLARSWQVLKDEGPAQLVSYGRRYMRRTGRS
jgi:hypothetical protein